MNNLGKLLTLMGGLDEAEALLVETVERARESLPQGHWALGIFLGNYGRCLTEQTRYAEAERALLEAHGIIEAALGTEHRHTVETIQFLLDLYNAWHEAEPDAGHDAQTAEWRAKLEATQSAAHRQTRSRAPRKRRALNRLPLPRRARGHPPLNRQPQNRPPLRRQARVRPPLNRQAPNRAPVNPKPPNRAPVHRRPPNRVGRSLPLPFTSTPRALGALSHRTFTIAWGSVRPPWRTSKCERLTNPLARHRRRPLHAKHVPRKSRTAPPAIHQSTCDGALMQVRYPRRESKPPPDCAIASLARRECENRQSARPAVRVVIPRERAK